MTFVLVRLLRKLSVVRSRMLRNLVTIDYFGDVRVSRCGFPFWIQFIFHLSLSSEVTSVKLWVEKVLLRTFSDGKNRRLPSRFTRELATVFMVRRRQHALARPLRWTALRKALPSHWVASHSESISDSYSTGTSMLQMDVCSSRCKCEFWKAAAPRLHVLGGKRGSQWMKSCYVWTQHTVTLLEYSGVICRSI